MSHQYYHIGKNKLKYGWGGKNPKMYKIEEVKLQDLK